MKLRTLETDRYRSLRDVRVDLDDLNLFIGANASGKSAVLDALRFLGEAVRQRNFRAPVYSRGGIVHLAWKGEEARFVGLKISLEDGDRRYRWSLRLVRSGYEFYVEEQVESEDVKQGSPPAQLLWAERGEGWWRSGERGEQVPLKQGVSGCALAAAAADASFPARGVADFIGRWGVFDPNPFLLRRDRAGLDSGALDPYGRNFAETLHALDPSTLERVVAATRAVVGLPEKIEPREAQDEGRFYFVQRESGLHYGVHRMGASSGTLRMLALMTALLADPEANLIGIEDPENNIHPAALSSFAEYLRNARSRVQILVTTHSPALLDVLNLPEAVRVVTRDGDDGAAILAGDTERVCAALAESGFGLGEYYETTGFGRS